MIHVPFRDQSQMYVGIANGDIGWAFSTLGSALPLIQAGKIKILAIAAKERLKTLPEVPTLEEAGGPPALEVDSWLGLMAPRGTPPDAIRRINADVNRALADPEVLEQMRKLGFEPAPGTPEQFAQTIAADARRYGEIVRRTGAKAD
jgi:tripartite-type tricarboxylate transporter receptor subunit TctC